jgi:peptidyl-prolyl cis-trans isomerase B (cyclophilin B)
MKRYKFFFVVAVAVLLAAGFVGCRKKAEAPATAEAPAETTAAAEEPETPLALSEEAKGELAPGTEVAVIELRDGLVEVELFTAETPKTAGNFTELVGEKFYDGLPFHRVVPGFVVQAGDAERVGRANPDITLEVEKDKRKCVRGAVSMARAAVPGSKEYGPTSPTQFFVLTGDSPHLDPDFCVFGVVVTGMDVVDEIEQGDVIKRIRVLTVGEGAEEPAA